MLNKEVRSLHIEVYKPGIFNIPANRTVAIFNRNLLLSDTCMFKFFDKTNELTDPTTKYHNLSDTCVNAVARYFNEQGYFQKVINYGDSRSLFKDSIYLENSSELYDRVKADVCIFLDFLHFNTIYMRNHPIPVDIEANLLWTVAIRGDSLAYGFRQVDTLFYDESQVSAYLYSYTPPKWVLYNSCQILGQIFGMKAIPSWIQVDRLYYKSNQFNLLNVEKYAKKNDWLKAAEFWYKETNNKNQKIASKACFNMALACEMEGKPGLGIDWLIKSYNALPKNSEVHKANCQQYINVLTLRKKEIEQLEKQLRKDKE
jgi:hypothetical protein